jgi:hypothetical protein
MYFETRLLTAESVALPQRYYSKRSVSIRKILRTGRLTRVVVEPYSVNLSLFLAFLDLFLDGRKLLSLVVMPLVINTEPRMLFLPNLEN